MKKAHHSGQNQRSVKQGCGCLLLLIIAAAIAGCFAWQRADAELATAAPFGNAASAQPFWDDSFKPQEIPGKIAPFAGLAPDGNASIHGDGAQSDVHPFAAPVGDKLRIRSRKSGNWVGRQCSTMTFRRDGNLIAMCGGISGFRMVLIDPDSLAALAYYDLPMRPSTFQTIIYRDLSYIFSDSSGGAYFVLDDQDRVIVGDADQQIRRLVAEQNAGIWQFRTDKQWDMKAYVPNDCLNYDNLIASGECDAVTTVVPGPDGLYWWTTRYGRIGTINPADDRVQMMKLDGEEIQNALAVDENGIYVLSDHAQYAFVSDGSGRPRIAWRQLYDRGSSRKLGSINQGSGTTPTLLGSNYITFADNADGQINLIVLQRGRLAAGQSRLICKMPLFKANASAAENSVIGWNRSIIVENNSGYTNAFSHEDWGAINGGVTRIDIREDESGCDVIWASDLVVPSVVAKLSQKTGIAYYYSFDLDKTGKQHWSIVGLDYMTGKLVQKIPTGTGLAWDNNWSSLAIGPDGSLYAGTTRGLLQVRAE